MSTSKLHWETIYETKTPDQVSWTQKIPLTSLALIKQTAIPKNTTIIDLGGGDSTLVDHLLLQEYTDISIVDISANALKRAQQRLGQTAKNVQWIEADIANFHPERNYFLWHDRACFHFLNTPNTIAQYKSSLLKAAPEFVIIATFAFDGPLKCSGLEITQYDEVKMESVFQPEYNLIQFQKEKHKTPFETNQNFIFCLFKRKS